MDATDETEIELIDYLRVIWKRKALIIAGTLACMVTAALVSLWTPNIYQATATLLISKEQLQVKLESQIETATTQDRSILTVKELLNSRAVQQEVIKKLDLKNDSKMLTAEQLEGKAQINDLRNTDLIELRITDTDPQRAASIANTWAELFIAHMDRLELQNIESTGGFILAQLQEATVDLQTSEEGLRDFSEQNRMSLLADQIKARSNKLVALELKKADLADKVTNQGSALKTTIYYSITGKMAKLQGQLSAIVKDFSEELKALIPKTKLASQASLTRISLNFKNRSIELLDREALRLSKTITDGQLASELEGKKQAIRLKELSNLEKNGTGQKGAQALNSATALFEARTGRDVVKSFIHSGLDPTVVLLRQERIDSDISRDIMQSQMANYREILIKLKKIKKMVVSEWENTPQEGDGGQAVQWIKEFQGLPQRLDLILMEFSHISSLEEQDFAEFYRSRIDILGYLQQLEAAQALKAEMRPVLGREVTLASFSKDSSEALKILRRVPVISSAEYIDELSAAQRRFQELSRDLDELKNLRTVLAAAFEAAGDKTDTLAGTVERSLEQLSSVDVIYGIATGPNPGERNLVSGERNLVSNGKKENGAGSFLGALISIRALDTEIQVVANSLLDLDVEIVRFQKELATGQFRQLQLQRGAETIRGTYEVLNKKWEEIKIARELRSGTISLAKAAYPPEYRIKPNRRLNTLLAGAVGLTVTMLLAFFLDYFQRAAEQRGGLAFSSTTPPEQRS